MIPILFDGKATNFNTNGIGTLSTCISCVANEEYNGLFEIELTLLANDPLIEQVVNGNLIVCKPNKIQDRQAFEIYKVSKPINGKVTIYAQHISYRASYIPVAPFSATGITETLNGLSSNSLEDNPFIFTTTLTNEESTYNQVIAASLRSRLGGTEGSLLDIFGGEYLWDNFNIALLLHRGSDNGVHLRYGKNITDLTNQISIENTITGVLPIWTNEENGIYIQGDIQYSPNVDLYPIKRTAILDLTSQFETAPSAIELNQAGLEYVSRQSVGLPTDSIKLSFIDLSQTLEAAQLQVLENVNLCDTVYVDFAPLGITTKMKVVRTKWDVLNERYLNLDLGSPRSTMTKTIADNIGDIATVIQTGKQLISVTQSINREIGEIISSVASVQGNIIEVDNRLTNQINTQATMIEQNTQEIVLRALQEQVDREFGEVEGRVETLETNVSVTTEGLKLKQNDDGSYVLVTDSGMEIYVNNQRQAYATIEGFNASTFLTGDWHIQPANNDNSLNFFKKGS